MDLKACIEQIQSYHDLHQFQTVYPDENIEYGLCTPENQKVFLTSSVAFLHKQLLRKLQDEDESKAPKKHDNASDLLILDSGTGQEIYINIKNAREWDEALKKEATVPKNKLSSVQLIPKVRKSKTKFTFFKVFLKSPSSKFSLSSSKSKKSFLGYGKKDEKVSSDNLPQTKMQLIEKYLKSVPSHLSILSSQINTNSNFSSTSYCTYSQSGFFDPRSSSQEKPICSYKETTESYGNILSVSDLTALNYLKQATPEKPLKIFECSKFRRTIDRKLMKNDDIFKVDELDSHAKSSSFRTRERSCIDNLSISSRARRQQSKLSVCREEESESEDEAYTETVLATKITSYNFTDELKSSLNPKILEIVVNKIIQDLKNDVSLK